MLGHLRPVRTAKRADIASPPPPQEASSVSSMGWPNAKCKHGSLLFSVVKSATSPDSQELKTSLNSVDSLLMEFPRSQQLRFTVRPFLLRCASMRNSHRRHQKGGPKECAGLLAGGRFTQNISEQSGLPSDAKSQALASSGAIPGTKSREPSQSQGFRAFGL